MKKTTKKTIVNEIFKIIENDENFKKLHGNYHLHKFMGLNWDYSQAKTSMALDLNRYSKLEYIIVLDEIKKVINK